MPPPPMHMLSVPTRMNTRAGNKDKRPGLIDLPDKPRRSAAEAAQSRQETAENQKNEAERLLKAVKTVASIEDNLRYGDERREAERIMEANTFKNTIINKKKDKKISELDDELPSSQQSIPPRLSRKKSTVQIDESEEERPRKRSKPLVQSTQGSESEEEERPKKKSRPLVQSTPGSESEEEEHPKKKRKQAKKGKKTKHKKYQEVSMEEDDSNSDSSSDEEPAHKSKKKPSRSDINRLRTTRPESGTPAVSKRNTNAVEDASQTGKDSKKKKTPEISGLLPGYKPDKKQVSSSVEDVIEPSDEGEDCPVHYGGLVPDNETDQLEEKGATKKGAKKLSNENIIKIHSNPAAPKTLVEARQGAKNWSRKNLPPQASKQFEDRVVPLLRMKAGLLPPWKSPSLPDMQEIVDDVYGKGTYKVTETSAWFGLMNARLHSWHHGFIEAAESSFATLLSENSKKLDTAEKIQELVTYYLSNAPDEESRMYQWREVNSDTDETKGFLSSPLITRTLGSAHLSKFPEIMADNEAKPVGALVEHVLNHWTTGHLVKGSNQFSAENYDDQIEQKQSMDPVTKRKTITNVITYRTAFFLDNIEVFKDHHWKLILDEAREYIPHNKKNKWKTTAATSSKQDDVIIIEAESNKRQRNIVVCD